jgi:hypothetical protein
VGGAGEGQKAKVVGWFRERPVRAVAFAIVFALLWAGLIGATGLARLDEERSRPIAERNEDGSVNESVAVPRMAAIDCDRAEPHDPTSCETFSERDIPAVGLSILVAALVGAAACLLVLGVQDQRRSVDTLWADAERKSSSFGGALAVAATVGVPMAFLAGGQLHDRSAYLLPALLPLLELLRRATIVMFDGAAVARERTTAITPAGPSEQASSVRTQVGCEVDSIRLLEAAERTTVIMLSFALSLAVALVAVTGSRHAASGTGLAIVFPGVGHWFVILSGDEIPIVTAVAGGFLTLVLAALVLASMPPGGKWAKAIVDAATKQALDVGEVGSDSTWTLKREEITRDLGLTTNPALRIEGLIAILAPVVTGVLAPVLGG